MTKGSAIAALKRVWNECDDLIINMKESPYSDRFMLEQAQDSLDQCFSLLIKNIEHVDAACPDA